MKQTKKLIFNLLLIHDGRTWSAYGSFWYGSGSVSFLEEIVLSSTERSQPAASLLFVSCTRRTPNIACLEFRNSERPLPHRSREVVHQILQTHGRDHIQLQQSATRLPELFRIVVARQRRIHRIYKRKKRLVSHHTYTHISSTNLVRNHSDDAFHHPLTAICISCTICTRGVRTRPRSCYQSGKPGTPCTEQVTPRIIGYSRISFILPMWPNRL